MSAPWPQTCNYCGAPLIGGRRCPRCSYQRPKTDEVKYSGFAGGGASAPGFSLLGTNSFWDNTQNTRQLTIPNLTIGAGSSIYVTCGFNGTAGGTQSDIVEKITWGSTVVLRTDLNSMRRQEYDDNTLTFSNQWILVRPGAGTNNLVIDLDQFTNAPISFAAAAIEIKPGPSAGDPMDRPIPTDITSYVSHCVATTFLQFYHGPGDPYPYTTTSTPQTGTFGTSPDLGIVCNVTSGPTADPAGTWSSNVTPLTRFGTSLGASDSNTTMAIATLTITTPTITQANKLSYTWTTSRGAVITLDSFRP